MSLFADLDDGAGGPVFDDSRVPIDDSEFDKHQRLIFEKEMLGLYISDHPLLGVEAALRRLTDTTIAALRDQAASGVGRGERGADLRWVGGIVTATARKYTKRGELMATFVLEDLDSSIEVWVFPRTMTDIGHLLVDDTVVCVRGRLDLRDDQPKLICMEIKRPELSVGAEPLHLEVPAAALTEDRVERLKKLLGEHPGESPVFVHVGAKCIRLDAAWGVEMTTGLLAELRVLLGPGCLWNRRPRSA
jgi:DNA polymerase-3 subunit alpha